MAYELALPEEWRIHPVFHVYLLWAYDAGGDSRFVPPPHPVQVGGHTEFEVACIVRHRRRGRGLQYLVEWVGYDVADATWEPERHLVHAPDKVAAYWAAQGDCGAAWLSTPEDASDLTSTASEVTSDSGCGQPPACLCRRTLPPC